MISSPTHGQLLKLSTDSQEAGKIYREGWHEIMNHGNYSLSERLYRKMSEVDPNFLIGLSLVARISREEEERKTILTKLKDEINALKGDERRLLEVYIGLIELTNARGEGMNTPKQHLRNRVFSEAYSKLGMIVQNYPDEVYYLSEYLEVIHYLHGAEKALEFFEDSIPPKHQKMPFIWGFATELYAFEGEIDLAHQMATELESMVPSGVPKTWIVWGKLYYERGLVKEALYFAERALMYDAGNIDAQRLKTMLLSEM